MDNPGRVSTIELFFDLVFVFTLTRLTHLVEHAHGLLDFFRAFLLLTLIWWIYAGYAWLTNGAGAERRMRPVLIAAMVGFLIIAIAVPAVFHGSGVMFGLAYLFIVLLHLGAFYSMGGRGIGRSVLRLAPFNIGAALFALAAGLVHQPWSWAFFIVAAATLAAATFRHSERGFPINAPHFVERHGLILIIALGETMVAIGTAAGERVLDARVFATIVLSIVLLAALWWSYFDRDDVRAEHALMQRHADERALVGIRAFWTPFLTMIFGIVLVAAGLRQIGAEDAGTGLAAPGAVLAVGTAIFLAGSAFFRYAIGIKPIASRLWGAAVALVLGGVGVVWGGMPALMGVTALVLGLLVVERSRRTGGLPTIGAESG